jgi:phosphoglycolate phosphatase-like HAD superfamily hydrolase
MGVLLFDVDGTLVSVGGAGRRAFVRAAVQVYGPGAAEALAPIRFDGMTDRLIVRRTCERIGRAYDRAECDRVFAAYVPALQEELAGTPFEVHEGVRPLLDWLAQTGASLGLGTGNVRAGAYAKLAHGGLDHHFAFGGFGEDGDTREAILQVALARAAERSGRRVAPDDVIVIGDTPRDMEAARTVGCRAVGVATGRSSCEALLVAGAHHAFATLADSRVRELLGGVEGASW